MLTRTAMTFALLTAVLHQPALAFHDHGTSGERAAIEACVGFNDFTPATLVDTVDDGFGDYLVWVNDRYGDLWMCNADAFGNIYLNVMLMGDLLDGHGTQLIGFQDGMAHGNFQSDPARIAEQLCEMVLSEYFWFDTIEMISVPDGMGDYLVWMETYGGELWACNASSDGVLYAFEPVDWPIATYEPGPMV